MPSADRLLALADLDTRRGRVSFGLVAVLVVAFAVSTITDPSPALQWVLGVALLSLIVLRTLLAMGVAPRRRR